MKKFLLKSTPYFLSALLLTSIISCDDDDEPQVENEVEIFTDIKLVFTNETNTTDIVTALAQDKDGNGAGELEIIDEINLKIGETYNLTFELANNLDTDNPIDLTAEILDEDDEHQFFFEFTDGAFSDPAGDGNIGANNASDPINYQDKDDKNLPVGLQTSWTASTSIKSNQKFRVKLQHQSGGIKTSTSNSTTGDNDFDVTFVLNVQ